MKKTILFLLLIISISSFAQSLKFTGLEVSSGKGAVTSGLYLYGKFQSESAMAQITLSQHDMELTYLFRLFKDKLLIGPNAGFFHNIPYASGMVVFTPVKYITTTHWYGWSFGQPDGRIECSPSLIFKLNAVALNIWRCNLTYSMINFMENNIQHILSLKYNQKVSKNFSAYIDAGYDLSLDSQLLKLGLNWNL